LRSAKKKRKKKEREKGNLLPNCYYFILLEYILLVCFSALSSLCVCVTLETILLRDKITIAK